MSNININLYSQFPILLAQEEILFHVQLQKKKPPSLYSLNADLHVHGEKPPIPRLIIEALQIRGKAMQGGLR